MIIFLIVSEVRKRYYLLVGTRVKCPHAKTRADTNRQVVLLYEWLKGRDSLNF